MDKLAPSMISWFVDQTTAAALHMWPMNTFLANIFLDVKSSIWLFKTTSVCIISLIKRFIVCVRLDIVVNKILVLNVLLFYFF